MTKPKTMTGDQIIQDLQARLHKLERILICDWCKDGIRTHPTLGETRCVYCNGTGNRLDGMETST